jgi:hypothetical protein
MHDDGSVLGATSRRGVVGQACSSDLAASAAGPSVQVWQSQDITEREQTWAKT